MDRQLLVSAEHGQGVEELREALALGLPELPVGPPPDMPAIAIVGRPNVGKSSLLNRIAGQPRALVSAEAGTTRDPLDTPIPPGRRSYLLIHTPRIRPPSPTPRAP